MSVHFFAKKILAFAATVAFVLWGLLGVATPVTCQVQTAGGNCAINTTVLYRLYNNGMGGAPIHRVTTSAAVFNDMLAAGWVFEGDGRTFAFACVPLSTAPSMS